MDTDKTVQAELDKADGVKKPPRKPRPSEIAAKKTKAAKKRKPAPKAKKKRPVSPAARAVVPKAAKRRAKAKKAKKAASGNIIRTERLDFRLSKKEKAKLFKAAKAQKRTITGVIQILIEKLP